ncbi:rod shape-determining protein RodA [Spirochaeta dissipatitropha]
MRRFFFDSSNNFSVDILLLLSTLSLCVIGVMFIYSSSVTATGELRSQEYLRQIIWLIPGIFMLATVMFIDYRYYRDIALYLFIAAIIALLVTRFFGQVVYGGRRWLGIGGIGFQPSEFTKIAYIIFLASVVARNRINLSKPLFLFLLLLVTMIPVGLILVQPDLGTAMVFIPIFVTVIFVSGGNIWFILIFVSGILSAIFFALLPAWMQFVQQREIPIIMMLQDRNSVIFLTTGIYLVAVFSSIGWFWLKKRWFIAGSLVGIILGTGILGGYVAGYVLRDYQMMRLVVFMNPNIDPRGAGWNIIQSLTAVGSGGFSGKGFLLGTHSHYQYIPQQTTDFIFSIVAEEWGFVGSVFIFGLYLTIFFRGLAIMRKAKDAFGAYICAGVTGMIFFHFMINIGMAIGLMPITGLPLFFLSYGGSSLWTGLIAIGLLQSVYKHRYSF